MCVNPSDFEFSPIVAEGAEQEKRAGPPADLVHVWYIFWPMMGRKSARPGSAVVAELGFLGGRDRI